jgi:4a-hydroxytetrahydrobiopterin dehydratase
MALLSEDEIGQGLERLDGWRVEDGALVLERKLEDFAGALVFVNRVGALAEAANHHPDILVHGWNKLRLTLSTHSEGGLTAADFDVASTIDTLLEDPSDD